MGVLGAFVCALLISVAYGQTVYECDDDSDYSNPINVDTFPAVIQTRNFPSDYDNDDNCVWLITESSNSLVFTVNDFDLPPKKFSFWPFGWFCSDFLRTDTGSYCDDSEPGLPDLAAGDTKNITFFSSSADTAAGFKITISMQALYCEHGEQVEVTSAGNPIMSNREGFVTYSPALDCMWHIKAPAGELVGITFDAFALAAPPSWLTLLFGWFPVDWLSWLPGVDTEDPCSFLLFFGDSVKIYDGDSTSSDLLETFCSTQEPSASVYSTDRDLFIRFRTDFDSSDTGFQITISFDPAD